jgi:ATP-binding cassette subfamily B protein
MRLLRDKIRAALRQFPHLGRTMRLVWDASRPWTIAWLTLLVLQGLLPAATVYLTRWLVDSVVLAVRVGGSGTTLRPALIAAALMGAILLLTELLRSVTGWVRTAQSELVQDHITTLIHAKSSSVDFAFYESPDYYDHLHRARTEAGFRPVLLLESLGGLLQSAITLIAMAAVLIPMVSGCPLPAGQHPARPLCGAALPPQPPSVVAAYHGRRAPHRVLRLAAHDRGDRRGTAPVRAE